MPGENLAVNDTTKGATFILAALICILVSRTAATKCLSCTEAARPRDCEYVQECGTHEKCSIEAYITTLGSITYNVGCMDRTKCGAVGKKRHVPNVAALKDIQLKDGFDTIPKEQWDQNQRDMLVCAECCDTELCNVKGCGELGLPPDSGPICYGCQQERYADQCNKVIICDRDYACHLSTMRIGVDIVYNSGCKHTQECKQLGILNIGAFDMVGRRSGYNITSKVERAVVCNKCCTRNLCNADTCSSLIHLSIASAITTQTPTKVNGGWNGWSHWNLCSVTCGGGHHYRVRACNNPSPVNGGATCSGANNQTQSCNNQPCVGGCLYKGHAYNEGQQWQDGCDYICTCVDGTAGFYKCYFPCISWNLPSVCYMEPPAPGKCCSKPKCPDNFRINYPVGYQEH